ncbi:MAG: ABC transporter permease [Bacillota bacterium]
MRFPVLLVDTYWVLWREIKRLLVQRTRIALAAVQPLIWLILMGNSMGGLTANPAAARLLGTQNYLEFMTPGIMVMSTLFGSVFGGVSIIWDRRTGFLNKMLAAPIKRVAIPLGKISAIALQGAVQVTFIAVIAAALGIRPATGLPGFLLILVILGLFSYGVAGISFALAAVIKSHEALMAVTNLLTLPMTFASNAIFPRAAMPTWLKAVAAYNPLTHAVTPVRVLVMEGWVWEKIWPGFLAVTLFAIAAVALCARHFARAES